MKNNQLTFILVGVFFLTTLGAAALTYKYISAYRREQALKFKLDYTQTFLNQLLTETAEYSKKDPGVTPILQSLATQNPAAMLPPRAAAK